MNATTIRTSSKNQFEKIYKYIKNKRISFVPSTGNGTYAITIFGLDSIDTDTLISKMTSHFHLHKMAPQDAHDGRDTSRPHWQATAA